MNRINSDKFILPPLAPSRMNRVYPKFHKFDVPGETDDLNDAMIAEDTRYAEVNSIKYPQERETVALRVQHKINEERREENRELRERNRQLENRTIELEEENERLRMQLKLLEERENTTKKTYENVVDRLLKAMVNMESRSGKDDRLDEQIKSLTSMLLQQSNDSDPRISATPPSEPL